MIYSIKRTRRQNKNTTLLGGKENPSASSRRDFVREFAPSDELPTGKDGAMLRTQRHSSPGEIPRTSRQEKKKKQDNITRLS